MKRIVYAAISISVMGFLASCGVPGNGSSSCTANVNGDLKILVTKLGQNSYSMQLCSANSNGNLINVYGGNSPNSVSSLALTANNTAPRNSGYIDNFIQAGASIQIDFYSSDTYFSIYPVVFSNGSYVTDFNHPLVASQQLPL